MVDYDAFVAVLSLLTRVRSCIFCICHIQGRQSGFSESLIENSCQRAMKDFLVIVIAFESSQTFLLQHFVIENLELSHQNARYVIRVNANY